MDDNDEIVRDRLDRVFHRVNTNTAYALPVCDLPADRVLGVTVNKVADIIGDLTLIQVWRLAGMAMEVPTSYDL